MAQALELPPPPPPPQIERVSRPGAALPRLGEDAFVFTPPPPVFLALVADTLGDAGSPADGFEEVLLTTASLMDADIDSLQELDQHLVDADFAEGKLAADVGAPMAEDHLALIETSGAALQKLSDFAAASLPEGVDIDGGKLAFTGPVGGLSPADAGAIIKIKLGRGL